MQEEAALNAGSPCVDNINVGFPPYRVFCLLILGLGVAGRGVVVGQVLDDLLNLGDELEAPPRLRFSGMADLQYVDGGTDITPSNLNSQGTAGGVSTFAANRVHLFTDVRIGDASSLFVHISGGVADDRRTTLDSLALTLSLGEGMPHLEIGRIPNGFSRFPTRFLPYDNPLVGLPLIYGYRTSLLSNQVPASGSDLASQAGQGHASRFAGYGAAASGLRLVSNGWYVNGVRLRHERGALRWSVAIHNEAISSDQSLDGSDSKTLTTQMRYRLFPSLDLGLSYSNGGYLDAGVLQNAAAQGLRLGDFRQEAFAFDGEYSAGHFQLFTEVVHSRWDTPNVQERLSTLGYFLEPRYRFRPGLTMVARMGRLQFGTISTAGGAVPWENDVQRVEVGLVHALDRDVKLKVSHQWNRTAAPGGSDPSDNLLQVQASAVF